MNADGPVSGFLLYGDKNPATRDMGGLPGITSPFILQVLPHYASNNTWYTGITLANPQAIPVNVDRSTYDKEGRLFAVTDIYIPPRRTIGARFSFR